MLKQITFILALIGATSMTFSACDSTQQLGTILDGVLGEDGALSNADIVSGLKQALEIGAGKGADLLSETDGFYKSPYKILLPAEARKVTERLQNIPGFSNLEERVLEKINRGAEDAASRAKPIFVQAIRSMTISDALGILKGDKNAATQYLERVTRQQLFNEFQPVIVESLDKFNARTIWRDAATTYNNIPLINGEADPNLDAYVTNQALDGLFAQVEKEERNIRENLGARTTDLLKRVFAAQDN